MIVFYKITEKGYKAIISIDGEPTKREEFDAGSYDHAMNYLKDKYGEDAEIFLTDVEAAQKIRD
ncbi:MAG: hypothetical protein AAF571_07295 [Verrucomicrobiota bacterium]